jgi:tRNA threonylcarbamoyladenosine biosynthesis protein TsaE
MNLDKTHQISTLLDLEQYAKEVLAELVPVPSGATVLGLQGDLGAGKTTFVQALARHLGVTEAVTSPTYLIMRSYETRDGRFSQLVHMDAYRIESLAELAPLRFAEVLGQPQTLVVIEWFERIAEALPAGVPVLTFTVNSDGSRTITRSW